MHKRLLMFIIVFSVLIFACSGGGDEGNGADGTDSNPDVPTIPVDPPDSDDPAPTTDAELSLYGTFHAMGVIVSLPASLDSDHNASAQVRYRPEGQGDFQQGFPLSRVADNRFVGSIFGLTPGTVYDVQVDLADSTDASLDNVRVSASAPTRSEIDIPPAQQTLAVSPSGDGDCSEIAPCSLGTAISQAGPGTTILLRGGVYYTGGYEFSQSGTQQAPIVISCYPGESAILDGADPQQFEWTASGNGLYQTTINVASPHVVMNGSRRLFPYDSLSSLETLAYDNTPGFFADGYTLYLHLAGGSAPEADQIIVSRYESAFRVTRDFIYFIDLTFRYYGQGGYPKAVYLDGASDCLVQSCTFANNDLGVGLKREAHRNVIEDSLFYDNIFDWPWQPIKDLGGIEDGGVAFYSPVDGRGNIIRYNTFHDDFDGFGACPTESAAITNETDIYGNRVYNMGDDGMETDGRCSNVRVWGNTFHDVLIGISLAPVYDGPVYCLRNLVYRTGVGNNNYPGSPFKFNSDYDQSGPIYLFHNTGDAYYAGHNGLDIKSPGSWVSIYARNNIWSGEGFAIENNNRSQPMDLDYDDLWNDHLDDLVYWGTRYATLEAFTAATAQEQNGFSVPPAFKDAPSGDYTLSDDSQLIDKGVLIPGINHDYNGLGPDIGAFEN